MPLTFTTTAMGTRVEIVLDGADASRVRDAGAAALDEIRLLHERCSAFDRASLLSHVNRTAHRAPVRLDADLFELFAEAADVHRLSGGAFDLTIGGAMAGLGLHPASAGAPASPTGAAPSMADVVLDPDAMTIGFARPGVSLDLGAIAKGHALDVAAAVVRESGVERALLHAGTSTAAAIGAPPGASAWRIALRTPDGAGVGDAPVVGLRGGALSVSAPHGRAVEGRDGPVTHLLDPRTGRPAPGPALAAVIAPRARTADAWSTALAVLGRRPPGAPAALTTCILDRDGRWSIEGPASAWVERRSAADE